MAARERNGGGGMTPDFTNPNREPVLTVMDLARLNDDEMAEGYWGGYGGLPCGGNRSRSYWHGWRQGARDGKHRDINGDHWDRELTRNIAPGGKGSDTVQARIEACRRTLRGMGELA